MGDNYFLLTNLLSEDERKVITGIAAHIERGEKRVGIQQIANENFLSTTSIVKMCKRWALTATASSITTSAASLPLRGTERRKTSRA